MPTEDRTNWAMISMVAGLLLTFGGIALYLWLSDMDSENRDRRQ